MAVFIIRDSKPEDGPELFDFVLKHRASWHHDHLNLGRDFIASVAGTNLLKAVVDETGEITGYFLVSDIMEGLHCQCHFLVAPKHYKAWLAEEVFEVWINQAFKWYNVVKLKVAAQSRQIERDTGRKDAEGNPIKRLTPLGRLLKRLKFFRLWMRVDEYLVNGTLQNGIEYELRREFWFRDQKKRKRLQEM